MKKYAYLARLEELLAALPEQERQDALTYYEEYFDAAGKENEEATAAALGDPAEVARSILEGEGQPAGEPSTTEAEAAAGEVAPPAAPEPPPLGAVAPPRAEPVAPPHRAGGIRSTFSKGGWIIFLLVVAVAFLVQLAALGLWLLRGGNTAYAVSTVGSETVPIGEAYGDYDHNGYAAQTESTQAGTLDSLAAAEEGTSTTPDGSALIHENIDPAAKLEIELAVGTVNFVTDRTAQSVTLTVEDYERYGVGIVNANGICKVTMKDYQYTGQDEGSIVTVFVPESGISKADVELGVGSVTLDGIAVEQLDVELGTGDVTVVGGLTGSKIDLETGVGKICAGTVRAGKVTLESGTGDVTADRIENAWEIEASAGTGNVDIRVAGRAEDYTFEGEAPTGALVYDGVALGSPARQGAGAGKLEAESGGGDVSVFFLSE